MYKILPSVSLLVVAYNEEKNIKHFLKSVLMQKEISYQLKKIIIVSDGSKDNTVNIVQTFKSNKIELDIQKSRIGKSAQLTRRYKIIETDYLIQSDADVVFSHSRVVENMIRAMEHDKKVMMCGGNPTPLSAKTFIEKSVNTTVSMYLQLRKLVGDGNNAFSADGRLLAFRKQFITKVTIPIDMIANDAFVYLICKSQGHKYKFIQDAIVFFRSPQTVKDQIRQNSRFVAAPLRMQRYFSKQLIQREYFIPARIYIPLLAKAYLKYPLECFTIFFINAICRAKALLHEKYMTAKWDMAITSKKLRYSA